MEPTAMDPVALITTAVGELSATLGGVAGPALGVGAAVLALTFGWGFIKRFIS